MNVSKYWLEKKIEELNEWLQIHSKGAHFEYAQNKQKRDYYVNKLIDLEENNLETIKI